MSYSMDMNKESTPDAQLPEGWREFKCMDMIPEVSSKGNDMFVCQFLDVETGKSKKMWLVSVEGKRWLLKQLLEACGVVRAEDKKYNWDFPDVIGKPVMGYVQVENETFINREGKEVTQPKSKIVEFKAHNGNPDGVKSADEIAWEN